MSAAHPDLVKSPSDSTSGERRPQVQPAKVTAKLPWQFRNRQSPGEAGGNSTDVVQTRRSAFGRPEVDPKGAVHGRPGAKSAAGDFFPLSRLLEHPAIWRGTSVARTEVLSTGYNALDERLPGGGWPRSGLIEILVSRFGVGELTLLLPALASLTHLPIARWCAWISPPFEPFAPSLAAHGIALEHVLIVRVPATSKQRTRGSSTPALWAFEQSLGSGACDMVLAWVKEPRAKEIRRLQLAAERGRTLGVLFRPQQAALETSHAVARIAVEPAAHGVRVTLLKSRGGVRGSLELDLQALQAQVAQIQTMQAAGG